jgi:S1-C subfamily serine protease
MIDDKIDDTLTEPTVGKAPSESPPPPPRKGISFGPALLLAFVLLAGGLGVGWALGNDEAPPTATTVAEGPTPEQTTPTIDSAEEPVAAVASALLPSMVQIEHEAGLGSGFVYDDDLVLTAAHVIDGIEAVQVRFADGSVRPGDVVGADAPHDIAVIAVETADVPAAPLALEEDLAVGQLAVALGSPWGLEQTVTAGVVSAVSRPVASPSSAQVLIQTDASINPGNSGGALANREGEVIGVNVQIFTTTGANSGVGFAVPIANAYQFASAIVAGDPIETAFLGVSGEAATGEVSGALITEIIDDGAALDAGLEVGDVVTAVDGLPVQSLTDLAARIRSYVPGDEVNIEVYREGELMTFEVVLGSAPPPSQ